MNLRDMFQIFGLGALLFLAMVGALHLIYDLTGTGLGTRTVYVTAAVFAVLMTPVLRGLRPR